MSDVISSENNSLNDSANVKEDALNQSGNAGSFQSEQSERPEWLPKKFLRAEDLAKSYLEQEKYISKLNKEIKAPEKYDFSSLQFEDDLIDLDTFESLAKELNLPQSKAEELAAKLYEQNKELAAESERLYQEEIEKLGSNAKERIARLNNIIDRNFNEEHAQRIRDFAVNAENLEILELLMKNDTDALKTVNAEFSGNLETVESIKQEVEDNRDKFVTDRNYQAQIQKRLERLLNK